MCVGLSARVVRLQTNGTAVVDASGARREVSAQLLDDLVPGDYVMVHAGAAIAKITSEDDEESESVLGSLF
ncbi:MAG: HypC/HybG/HupF family hydrogenase formation chaperone [Lachnospiraceae bacterium]|jgi:hydrogenase expression/formation protein HypC|nr:HypC/HybG/HupF family hydrogenase formation chaperone [Lachnospiraceae bacterium]MEE1163076.1 HypC/HybG/HupF family hydrogenase formation chaperone [Lachnospiraceae bacterium]